jgi:hypothetical protein
METRRSSEVESKPLACSVRKEKERVPSFESYNRWFIFSECLLCTCVLRYVLPEKCNFGHLSCSKLFTNLCFLYNFNYLLIDYGFKICLVVLGMRKRRRGNIRKLLTILASKFWNYVTKNMLINL